jgi:hypothetical protein
MQPSQSIQTSPWSDFRLLPETQQHISQRTQNALKRGGYDTAQQIMLASGSDLMKIRNFGPLALTEVANWREALMQQDDLLFQQCLKAVITAMDQTESITSEKRARAAMRAIWQLIADGPFTACRIRQLLISNS